MTRRTPEINIARLEAVQADANVVDIRDPGEYVAGHVPGARLVPMGQLPARADLLVAWRPLETGVPTGR